MDKYKNKFPIIAGLIFVITAVTAVAYSWLKGLYKYDLRLSFSEYVGLHYSMSVLYFISAVMMLVLLSIYAFKLKLPILKKIVYAVVFLCIFGTAFFPCNGRHSITTTILHNYFAIGLMLAATVSFVLSAILTKSKIQRIIAVLSLIYAAVFVVMFFIGFKPLFQTFFIWENLFIILLLLGLHMEQYGEKAEVSDRV